MLRRPGQADGLWLSTLRRYRVALNNLIEIVGGSLKVRRVQGKHIQRFKEAYRDSHSPTGININLRAIKTFLIWLEDEGRIENVSKIKLTNIAKPRPIYVSNSELADIVKRVDSHFGRAFFFYRETGCRLSEPFYSIINGSFLTIAAENAKSHQTRDFFLVPELLEILNEMKHRFETLPFKSESIILRYGKEFQKACRQAGIKGKKFHSLRHSTVDPNHLFHPTRLTCNRALLRSELEF